MKEDKVVCIPKAHPACRLKKTLEYLRKGYSLEEAKKLAEEECIREGKLHGLSKLKCEIAKAVAKMMAEEKGVSP